MHSLTVSVDRGSTEYLFRASYDDVTKAFIRVFPEATCERQHTLSGSIESLTAVNSMQTTNTQTRLLRSTYVQIRKQYDCLAELARDLETVVREQSDFTEEQFIKIKDQFKTKLLQVISFNLL
jgi:hypothetical protein